ncbi:hypothetical protein LTS17_007915 [Exophiala oligosperma]
MTATKPWLEALTLDKLHRVAVTVGSPCSGTKAVRLQGIRNAITDNNKKEKRYNEEGRRLISLLSIDMGIRNLAYAHFTAKRVAPSETTTTAPYTTPTLQAWSRLSVSDKRPAEEECVGGGSLQSDGGRRGNAQARAPRDDEEEEEGRSTTDQKESFEPDEYARHAYSLIKHMLQTYKPDVILIERQRFRSGGRAAVPEWTIRVGVFEGMLYAVLRTLIESQKLKMDVEPMLPTRVNRYWLEGGQGGPDSRAIQSVTKKKKRPTGREVKSAKIDLVGRILENLDQSSPSTSQVVNVGTNLRPFAEQFVSVWKKTEVARAKKGQTSKEKISKLDDLADSFLQGLAWIHWQNNRQCLDSLGADAVEYMKSGWPL